MLFAALPDMGATAAKASTDNFTEVLPYENQFTDVPTGEWYASVVGKAYSYGLITGKGKGRFDPQCQKVKSTNIRD